MHSLWELYLAFQSFPNLVSEPFMFKNDFHSSKKNSYIWSYMFFKKTLHIFLLSTWLNWSLQPCGILAPQPWIEPGPFAMGALSPTHWTTWNSRKLFLIPQPNVTFSLTSQSSYLKLPTVFSLLFPSFTKWWNKYRTVEHSHNEPHRITTTFSNPINLLYFLMSTTLQTQRNPLHMPSWSPSSFLRGNL